MTKKSNKKNNKRAFYGVFLIQSYDCEGSFMICYGPTPDFLNACGSEYWKYACVCPWEKHCEGWGSLVVQLVQN